MKKSNSSNIRWERFILSLGLLLLSYLYMKTRLFGAQLVMPLSGFFSIQLFFL
ncbi:hypothetical protein ACV3PA_00855 [Exiguobacterium acetylicum]